jgi:hypothetical protein
MLETAMIDAGDGSAAQERLKRPAMMWDVKGLDIFRG